jgi:hypothetical protein
VNERRETRRAIPTCSSWYPNYEWRSSSALILARAARKPLGDVQWHELLSCVDEGGLVEGFVSLSPTYRKPCWYVRIAFWGADDTGICRDREFAEYADAQALYEHLSRWLSNLILVDRDVLFTLGFHFD